MAFHGPLISKIERAKGRIGRTPAHEPWWQPLHVAKSLSAY